MKIKKTYSFAFFSSLFITVFATIALFLSAYFLLDIQLKHSFLLLFISLVFLFTFVITQYRLEKFIYQRIKKIYESVSLLDKSDFNKTSITSDLATLSREVERFAENKQQQIKKKSL